MQNFNNLPVEMRAFAQWVCWKLELIDGEWKKLPYCIQTGRRASVTDPASWGSFDAAVSASQQCYPDGTPWYSGVGFVLTQNDPYCIVDLDNKKSNPAPPEVLAYWPQLDATLDTFTETSFSGTGRHHIVRGKIPHSVKEAHLEVYSEGRFFALTGDCQGTPRPIRDCQSNLDTFIANYSRVEANKFLDEVTEEKEADDALLVRINNAEKGPWFAQLSAGDWAGLGYASRSEGVHAWIGHVAYLSPCNEQVRRLFCACPLGQQYGREAEARRKANWSLRRIRPKFDSVNGLAVQLSLANLFEKPAPVYAAPAPKPPVEARDEFLAFPSGLVGEVAEYLLSVAIYPNRTIALAGALGIMGGICGRSFNGSRRCGLNLYLAMLGAAGIGKEVIKDGADWLFRAIKTDAPMIPNADTFKGPSRFPSGPGIVKALVQDPSCFSVLAEVGYLLQSLTDINANPNDKLLTATLLDLYSRSGFGKTLERTTYSKEANDVEEVISPSVTIVGVSTPEPFYAGLSDTALRSGLPGRFLILETLEDLPEPNPNTDFTPPPDLVRRMKDLVTTSLTNNASNAVTMVEQLAGGRLIEYEAYCRERMKESGKSVKREIWKRCNLNAIKLASLTAVGCNWHAPKLTREHEDWAIGMVDKSAAHLLENFDAGALGGYGVRLQAIKQFRLVVNEYFEMGPDARYRRKTPAPLCESPHCIPLGYITYRLDRMLPFKDGSLRQSTQMFLKERVESGDLIQLSHTDAKALCGHQAGVIYVRGQSWNQGDD